MFLFIHTINQNIKLFLLNVHNNKLVNFLNLLLDHYNKRLPIARYRKYIFISYFKWHREKTNFCMLNQLFVVF